MEDIVQNQLYNMQMSYVTPLPDIFTQHFLKIILDEKKMSSKIEIDRTRLPEYKVKQSLFFINEIKLHVRAYYATDNSDSDSSIALLIKVFSGNTTSCNYECSGKLFLNELKMHQDVLPKIETLLQSKIGPELYHHSDKFKVIFMKDPLNQGYQVTSVYKGMTVHNCREAIQLMARLHAASVALHEKDPELVEALTMKNMVTTRQCEHLMQIFHNNMKRAIALMEKTPPYQLIAENMRTVHYYIKTSEQILDMFNCEPEEFRVLNNGDFSITNVLFSTQGLPPVMQHYQMANYSSPAIDLHHFLNTSPENKVIYDYNHEAYMLNIYLKTLTKTMKALNCKTTPPTMIELEAAMQKRQLYAVFAAMTFRLSIMDTEEREQEMDSSPFEQLAIKMNTVRYCGKYFYNIINCYDSQSESSTNSNGTE